MEPTPMTIPLAYLFPSHGQARQAAGRLHQAGVAQDQVSLLDQHGGGTLLTVQATAEQAALVATMMPGVPRPGDAAPRTDMTGLEGGAPAYVAGGAANLGTPGPD